MNRRLFAILRKETWHILRDWQSLIIIIAMPTFMMFLYGYAFDVNINDVPVLIVDPQPTPETAAIARAVDHSSLFKVSGTVRTLQDPLEVFKTTNIRAIIRFMPGFTADLRRGGAPATVQVLIDGADQNLGTILRNAAEPFLQKTVFDLLQLRMPAGITVKQTILYNPQQKAAQFFVPGLVALFLMMICALLTSLTITREKEHGTMEQLLISPVRPVEILVGKIAPYIVLSALDGFIILAVGRFVFGVHIMGSLLLLSAAAFIFIFVALSVGLLVSTVAKKQEHAMLMVMPPTILPTVMLSGFIFPVASMPVWLQVLSAILPPTYFLQIIRGVILKGVGMAVLWPPVLVLSLMGLFLLALSVRAFREKA
ncbi:MAG TPA: ABC transporter permease [Chitinivibrionales bacterium]|nr:ABC transporter permease [Chitinivibrionales bacterium]